MTMNTLPSDDTKREPVAWAWQSDDELSMLRVFDTRSGGPPSPISTDSGKWVPLYSAAAIARLEQELARYKRLECEAGDTLGDRLDLWERAVAAEAKLRMALDRLRDMLCGDDGQAWKEAQRFLDSITGGSHADR